MGKVVKSIFGGSKPKASDGSAANEVTSADIQAKKSRTALLATQGGITGQELAPSEVQKRKETLLGN